MGLSSSLGTAGLKQGVCTSTTRPTGPYEGQMIYETDTDMVAIWNGTAWRYIAATTPTNGTILQTVYGGTTTNVSNNTNTFADTTLTATITPKSTSSKVLVMIAQQAFKSNANAENRLEIKTLRGATQIATTGSLFLYSGVADYMQSTYSLCVLDNPATTSATTYKTQFQNPNNTASVQVQTNSSLSTIILQEIAG
jgi:hypothetical protein